MSLKTALVSRIAERITGAPQMQARRAKGERQRVAANSRHVVEYFHQADDPYSHLTAQVLGAFSERYDIALKVHLVGPPPDWAAPERERLEAYARSDADALAKKAGLDFHDPGTQPDMAARIAALRSLASAVSENAFSARAPVIGRQLWSGDQDAMGGSSTMSADEITATGDARRAELGHYLGATFHYGGEWYWGIDRLHYLESRLTELGARTAPGDTPLFAPPPVPSPRSAPASAPGKALHYYLSFRSPYTYIAAQRAKALADAYGADLKLRFVLPMVMRGLPVPRMKSRYITLDTAREARRLGIPFGRIADPVGRPVERGYSLLPWAREQARGFEFCQTFFEGVWSGGVDAGSDRGMKQIVEAAGLDWQAARNVIGNDDWRAEAEANRTEMMDLGIWGVPSFRVGDTATWGQDRLWFIEDALKQPQS
ncbi:DsbA family protein [Hyphomonas sp.]|jgi:2-hydroxychromene-2-carboxylate isomerase|uniref:DsbA family protein n=1 Tax=Hyphomonas sp. TaxID=87 RepID=UPI0039E41105